MNTVRTLVYYGSLPFRYIARLPMGIFGAPRQLLSLSLPARVAALLALFLTLLTITAYVAYFFSNDRSHWGEWLTFGRIIVILALLIAIPVVVYQALKLWLEGDKSRYPDIDKAWSVGVEALGENGLELSQIPLFLMLGSPDEKHADTLMASVGFEFVVQDVPQGRAPLRWYANDHAIFLFCPGNGCLGRFNSAGMGQLELASTGHSNPRGTAFPANITGTLVAGSVPNITDTGPAALATDTRPPVPTFGSAGLRGTLVPDAQVTMSPDSGGVPAPTTGGKVLSHRELDEQSDRFRYICELIRRSRQPLCPLNGILTALPLPVLDNIVAAKDLPEVIRRDLDTVLAWAQISCPITVLVTGMELEPGFSELVRRVGIKRSKETRFGKGFKVWDPPTGENMDALSSHACGAFEDWVYTLFREKDGLKKPGNSKLYTLLCRIRNQLHSRLRGVLLHGFSCDGEQQRQPLLFGGCYFAATGDTEDRQAFVRSAIEKMVQQEEELEWTNEAVSDDRRYHQLAQIGMFVNGLLVLTLVALAVYGFWL